MFWFMTDDIAITSSRGPIIALVDVITTTVYQSHAIVFERWQNEPNIQVNHAVLVVRSVIALVAALLIEIYERHNLLSHIFYVMEAVLIILTGGLGVVGDRLDFSLMRQAGAMAVQVCEQVATMIALSFCMMRIPDEMGGGIVNSHRRLMGMIMTIVGMTVYTFLQMRNRHLQIKRAEVLPEGELDGPESDPNLIEPPDVVTGMADGGE
jgi:hypothetical protein